MLEDLILALKLVHPENPHHDLAALTAGPGTSESDSQAAKEISCPGTGNPEEDGMF